jgi:putative membrane protein
MTDADIFGLLEAAHQADLHAGQVAQRRASDPQVRTYARRMESDHDVLLKKGRQASAKLKIPPGLGEEGRDLLREHTDDMAEVQTQTGLSFDQKYVQHEIDLHQKLLHQIDHASQHTQRPELKTLVEQLRPALQEHLRAARTLQQRVGADGHPRKASEGR